MPMEPTDALQEHVDRAKVGEQQINVHVQGLLYCLCRNQDATPIGPLLTDAFLQRLVQRAPIDSGEAAMVRSNDALAREQEPFARSGKSFDGLLRRNAVGDRVPHDEDLRPSTRGLERAPSDLLGGI
jgi:hypothetical protein